MRPRNAKCISSNRYPDTTADTTSYEQHFEASIRWSDFQLSTILRSFLTLATAIETGLNVGPHGEAFRHYVRLNDGHNDGNRTQRLNAEKLVVAAGRQKI